MEVYIDFSLAGGGARHSTSDSSDEPRRNPLNPSHTPSVGEASSNTVPTASTPSTCSGPSGSRGKKRPITSWVWIHTTKREIKNANGEKENRACCNYCDNNYSANTDHGTGSIAKHLRKHHPEKIDKVDSKDFSDFVYSKAEMKKGLCRYVAAAEQPFTFADIRFEHFVRNKLNPAFKKVSRNTIRSDMLAEFNLEKVQFISEGITSFARGTTMSFTSDMWSGGNNRGYLALTAHYIDSSWKLHKKIIAFRLVEYPHNATTIFQTVHSVFREYNVADKVFSITFDNHSANTASIELFIQNLSTLHGDDLFHMRCVCHIINLVVQDGLKTIGPQLSKIKNAILFITTSPSRQQEFDAFCLTLGLKHKKLNTDVKTRWNSTFLMLRACRVHYKAISDYVNPRHGEGFLLSPADWKLAFEFMRFLKVFYNSTCACSGVLYPTSCIVLHQLYNISHQFHTYRLLPNFVEPCHAMEEKFKKYFEPMPKIFTYAAVMDPRIKLRGVQKFLKGICDNFGLVFDSIDRVKRELVDLFASYEVMYASSNVSSTCPELDPCLPTPNPEDAGWYLLSESAPDIHDTSPRSELNEYLDSVYKQTDSLRNFDILGWWQKHESKYPILHIMARDLLTPPVSSVASESAFSAGERVLDDKRSRLAPDILDCLMCFKDWEDTALGIHPRLAKDEFQNYFADSDIDD